MHLNSMMHSPPVILGLIMSAGLAESRMPCSRRLAHSYSDRVSKGLKPCGGLAVQCATPKQCVFVVQPRNIVAIQGMAARAGVSGRCMSACYPLHLGLTAPTMPQFAIGPLRSNNILILSQDNVQSAVVL